ncbi:MAG: hypothetical protein WBE51_21385, partial [Xanthobacteraceae bacterium]
MGNLSRLKALFFKIPHSEIAPRYTLTPLPSALSRSFAAPSRRQLLQFRERRISHAGAEVFCGVGLIF